MADHPLTDEICKSIAVCYPYNNRIDIEDCGHLTDMRAAYDKGRNDQLEQVVEWLRTQTDYSGTFYYETLGGIETIEDALMSAMRPQEDNS